MPAKKGTKPPRAGLGRRKGSRNRIPRAAAELLAGFLDATHDVSQAAWLKLLKTNPGRALEIRLKAAEMIVAKKLSLTDDGDAPMIGISFADGGPGMPLAEIGKATGLLGCEQASNESSGKPRLLSIRDWEKLGGAS